MPPPRRRCCSWPASRDGAARFFSATVLGLVAALVVALQGEPPAPAQAEPRKATVANTGAAGWRLLVSPPIMLNLVFFILLSVAGGGLNNFLIAALGALHGTPPALANTALTGLLLLSALGVLAGGWLTGRIVHHGWVAVGGLIVTALICVMVGLIDFPGAVLVVLLSTAGFFSGIIMPSRDMIVRAVTPAGAYGRVFGFVSTGFNIGGIVSPLIFGQFLDQGQPAAIFFCVAGCTLASIATVAVSTSRPQQAAQPTRA